MITRPEARSTIPAALAWAASEFGHEEAIVDGDIRWSFEELYEESRLVAAALIARGVAPGDRVALWAPNSARWVAASFGVYLVGAVLVPVNTRFKGSEVGHVLRRSSACLLLASTDSVGVDLIGMLGDIDELPGLREIVVTEGSSRARTVAWSDFVAAGSASRPSGFPPVRPADLSDIIFTSGTTGAPKGAMLHHGASVRTYEAWSERRRAQIWGSLSLCLSLFPHCGPEVGHPGLRLARRDAAPARSL